MRRSHVIAGALCGTAVFGLGQLPFNAIVQARGTGIVQFEFAATASNTERILQEWGLRGRHAMQWSLALDYPFLVFYGALLAALVLAMAERKGRNGRPFAWMAVGVSGCDAVENAALALMTNGHTAQPLPGIAAGFAQIKFLLLAFVLGYLLMSVQLLRRRPAQ